MHDIENDDPRDNFDDDANEGIAIIGMSGRFPGARDLCEFWDNLAGGVESITFFDDDELLAEGFDAETLRSPDYVKAKGYLPDVEMFDAEFFGYSARDAELTDPQHRLFLEHAWISLEDAGYDSAAYDGLIGIYGGMAFSTYALNNILPNIEVVRRAGELHTRVHNDKDFLASTAAYKLDLRGPAVTVQTACSTSLVAVGMACQSLMSYQCDMALAGGVAVGSPVRSGYFARESLFSPDGHCRAFDAEAGGTVDGYGVALVVLKRLAEAVADGDRIRAVIRGFAVNNDGAVKVGYFAPSVDGQAEVIAMAQAMGGVEPDTVSYIEAHGTGTKLGDPIEVDALSRVFRSATDRKGFCALGSVKTNIGHLDAAAGTASLIKTVLALEHRQIPPSLHFNRPNPEIPLDDSPFYVNTRLAEWPSDGVARRAGVSSFGLGGVNAHVVVEEAPEAEAPGPSRSCQLVVLSARTETALEAVTDRLVEHLKQNPRQPFADVAYTGQVGRHAFHHRRSVVCHDRDDAISVLDGRDPRRVWTGVGEDRQRPVAFLFPGLGSHYVAMGRELYQGEPTFREQVDFCCRELEPHLGLDLRDMLDLHRVSEEARDTAEIDLRGMLRPDGGEDEASRHLRQTRLAQPAQFVVEYALARLWTEWGIEPRAMAGYSIGEYVAACLAGVMTLEDALFLVARRARMIQELPEGAMLAVPLPEEELREGLPEGVSVAAVNGPAMVILAGVESDVAMLEERLSADGVACRRLWTTHAFHSQMMEPIVEPFAEVVGGIGLRPPEIPYLTNVTGTWITPEQATDPAHWAHHLRAPVRFGDILRELWREPGRILLEVGPGQSLGALALQHPARDDVADPMVLPSMRHSYDNQSDTALILSSLGKLWLAGVEVDWEAFHHHENPRRVALPTYPFERRRYWIEHRRAAGTAAGAPPPAEVRGPVDVADPVEAAVSEPRAPGPVGVGVGVHPRPRLRNPHVEPRNETEAAIAGIWNDLLGIREVGIYDNFFELGGDSVIKLQFISRAKQAGLELTPRQVFGLQTVAELAEVAGTTRGVAVRQRPVVGELPLTPIQHDFFEQDLPDASHWNQAIFLELQRRLEPALLHVVVERLLLHHDALRLRFEPTEQGWRQTNAGPDVHVPFVRIDLSSLPEAVRSPAVERVAAWLQTSLDLSAGPVFRAAFFDFGEGTPDRFFLLTHHLVADAVSWRFLIEDLVSGYEQLSRGEAVEFPSKTTSYRDWARRLSEYAREASLDEDLEYWLDERWRGATPLPRDLPEGTNIVASAGLASVTLGAEETRILLQQAPQVYGVQMNELLLAPLARAFSRWTDLDALLLELEGHGREPLFDDIDLSRTVGWFTPVFPVLLNLDGCGSDWSAALKGVEQRVRASSGRGLTYGVLRHLRRDDERTRQLRQLPHPEVGFLYFGQFDQMLAEAGPFSPARESSGPDRPRSALQKYVFYITAMVTGGQLRISWTFSEDLHHRSTVEGLAEDYRAALASLAASCVDPVPATVAAGRFQEDSC